jgi:hypothetical protein
MVGGRLKNESDLSARLSSFKLMPMRKGGKEIHFLERFILAGKVAVKKMLSLIMTFIFLSSPP